MTSVTMAAESGFLRRDEYIDRQNRHDELLNKEFRNIRQSINQVKSELKEFKDDVQKFRTDVNHRFDDVNRRFDELNDDMKEFKVQLLRNAARTWNSDLRNPKYHVRPLPAIRDRSIIEPDLTLFPRHADEFYTLRDPSTDHQRRMLAYLASFYDVPHAPNPTSSDSNDNSDDDHDPIVIVDPEDTVGYLEIILGLREDNFEKFRQRALEFANRPRPLPIKRSQLQPPEEVQHPHRPKVSPAADLGRHGTETVHARATPSDRSEVDYTSLKWGPRSTPSSQRPTVNQLRQKSRERAKEIQEPSDAGSTTNPNTSVGEGE